MIRDADIRFVIGELQLAIASLEAGDNGAAFDAVEIALDEIASW